MTTESNKLYLRKRIIEFLEDNPGKPFRKDAIAESIFNNYREQCLKKLEKSEVLKTENDLIAQLGREISAESRNIDHPRIKIEKIKNNTEFYYNETGDASDIIIEPLHKSANKPAKPAIQADKKDSSKSLSELDLYPILWEYLQSGHPTVYAKHINDKESEKNEGLNGHKWRHPDLVGVERIGEDWGDETLKCASAYSGDKPKLKLWSFEVKKEITKSASRGCFFQTVSNSSWANFGYLVAEKIHESAMKDLSILSSLHGIGLIELNVTNPTKSRIMIPAQEKTDINWGTVGSLVKINKNFEKYIQSIRLYYGRDPHWDADYWEAKLDLKKPSNK